MPKISAKFDRGHPYEGAECRLLLLLLKSVGQVGWVKIGDF